MAMGIDLRIVPKTAGHFIAFTPTLPCRPAHLYRKPGAIPGNSAGRLDDPGNPQPFNGLPIQAGVAGNILTGPSA
jgi:hypothetical protein